MGRAGGEGLFLPLRGGDPQDGGNDEDIRDRDEQNWDLQEDHIGHLHADHTDGNVSTSQLQDSQDLTGEVVDDIGPTEGQLNYTHTKVFTYLLSKDPFPNKVTFTGTGV